MEAGIIASNAVRSGATGATRSGSFIVPAARNSIGGLGETPALPLGAKGLDFLTQPLSHVQSQLN